MFLKRLNLTNFRNYSTLEVNFDQRPTILLGNNAVGKSNLLEAIYLLSTAKSLRVETEDELIKKEEEFTKIEGFLVDSPSAHSGLSPSGLKTGGDIELLVIINKPTRDVLFRKKVLVNGIGRRIVDFIGNLPAVIFYPADINLVTGPPSLRRWHLDLALAQIDPEYEHSSNLASLSYKKALTLYEQFLTARNRVLKRIREGFGKPNELDYWTEELVKLAKVISDKRKVFFEFINALERPLGEFMFEYKPSEMSVDRLLETNGREVAAAATLIGPHRDDFDIVTSGRNLRRFGSRGEQRIATLAFKLLQLEYMAFSLGKRPILLLDDVFSELDAPHRAHVVGVVSKQQTIIATVDLENIPKDFLDSARILRVEDGHVHVN
ncbi:MAG: DNA replication and repair protein RecF [Candidatus Daviesbacteria bacterium]|nr:DNA replication and repair protein RecF [Candidatus Daviesbacteria bacterium]